MTYIALKTRSHSIDYTWRISTANASKTHEILQNLTDEKRSCAVIRDDIGYSVYLGGIDSGLIDGRQRAIRMSVAFCGLTEHQARSIVVLGLRHPDSFRKSLCAAVQWKSDNADGGWSVDFDAVGQILESAATQGAVKEFPSALKGAWEGFFIHEDYEPDKDSEEEDKLPELLAKSASGLEELASDLEQSSFSTSSGVKLLVSTNPQGGYERALQEADRLLWSGGEKRDLAGTRLKKKAPIDVTPSTRSYGPSTTPSEWSSPSPSCQDSGVGCWISSNKGLVIICGVVAIGLLLGVTCKKKVPELKDVKPATNAIPTPAGKQQPTGKNVSPASDRKAVPGPNSDEKAPIDTDKLKESPEKEESKEP